MSREECSDRSLLGCKHAQSHISHLAHSPRHTHRPRRLGVNTSHAWNVPSRPVRVMMCAKPQTSAYVVSPAYGDRACPYYKPFCETLRLALGEIQPCMRSLPPCPEAVSSPTPNTIRRIWRPTTRHTIGLGLLSGQGNHTTC